jgi:hypothetical protein
MDYEQYAKIFASAFPMSGEEKLERLEILQERLARLEDVETGSPCFESQLLDEKTVVLSEIETLFK